MIYAGIGSRETPPEVLELMTKLAKVLGKGGWMLRSGAAEGADSAFEKGADAVQGKKQIFLPWDQFNDRSVFEGGVSKHFNGSYLHFAKEAHPNWVACSEGAKKLLLRNASVLFGPLGGPCVDVVVCWTKGGKPVGGTGHAVRMAQNVSIPIVNLGDPMLAGIPMHKALDLIVPYGK